MKIVRLKKGANDFAIGNLTLGQIMAIHRALEGTESPVGNDVKIQLDNFFIEHGSVDSFGEDCVGKIVPHVR